MMYGILWAEAKTSDPGMEMIHPHGMLQSTLLPAQTFGEYLSFAGVCVHACTHAPEFEVIFLASVSQVHHHTWKRLVIEKSKYQEART